MTPAAALLLLVAAARPDWVDGMPAAFPRDRFLVAVGTGDERGSAELRARAGVAAFFESRIAAVAQVQEVEGRASSTARVQEPDGSVGTAAVELRVASIAARQEVTAATAKLLEGVEIGDAWTDPTGRVFALAVLDRTRAIDVLRRRLAEVDGDVAALAARLGGGGDLVRPRARGAPARGRRRAARADRRRPADPRPRRRAGASPRRTRRARRRRAGPGGGRRRRPRVRRAGRAAPHRGDPRGRHDGNAGRGRRRDARALRDRRGGRGAARDRRRVDRGPAHRARPRPRRSQGDGRLLRGDREGDLRPERRGDPPRGRGARRSASRSGSTTSSARASRPTELVDLFTSSPFPLPGDPT